MEKRLLATVAALLSACALHAGDIEIRMSLNDIFEIKNNPDWTITVDRYMPLRLADISIISKKGYDFDLKLYFKCDTKDLARFDTREKALKSVLDSSKPYLPYCVEKAIAPKPLKVKRFGFYAVLTDKKLAKAEKTPPGEYKYMTRGLYRTADDSVLGFSLMTNDIDSKDYEKLLEYILAFEK